MYWVCFILYLYVPGDLTPHYVTRGVAMFIILSFRYTKAGWPQIACCFIEERLDCPEYAQWNSSTHQQKKTMDWTDRVSYFVHFWSGEFDPARKKKESCFWWYWGAWCLYDTGVLDVCTFRGMANQALQPLLHRNVHYFRLFLFLRVYFQLCHPLNNFYEVISVGHRPCPESVDNYISIDADSCTRTLYNIRFLRCRSQSVRMVFQ